MQSYLHQNINPDMLYFITDKGLIMRGNSIVVPTKLINVTPSESGQDTYTFSIEVYVDDPEEPEEFTFDVYSKPAINTIIQTLHTAINSHINKTATDQILGHVKLSDATDDLAHDASTGGTAATPKAVAKAKADLIQYINDQIGNMSQGMRIIGTYGLQADNPDEYRVLNAIPATEGDTYICISEMTGVTYTNFAGLSVSNATLGPGDYIICVQSAVTDGGEPPVVTTPARWTIVANPNTNAVTTNEALTDGAVIVGNGNKTVRKLNGGSVSNFVRMGSNGKAYWGNHTNPEHGISYGVCETTPVAGAEMKVEMHEFTPQPYAIVSIQFVGGVSERSALNVAETGANPIIYHNELIVDGIIEKGDTATFMFVTDFHIDGAETAAWVLISIDRAPDNTPSSLSAFINDIQALLVCSTAGNNNSKTITRTDITIKAGSVFAVRFSNAVGAGSTLNINSTGAKPIKHRNATINDYQIRATDTATFIYDGSAYHLLSIDRAFDPEPTDGSHNLVDSDAIYNFVMSQVDEATLYWEEMQ